MVKYRRTLVNGHGYYKRYPYDQKPRKRKRRIITMATLKAYGLRFRHHDDGLFLVEETGRRCYIDVRDFKTAILLSRPEN